MIYTGVSRFGVSAMAVGLAASLSSCESRTVVYTSPAPAASTTTTVVRTPARPVTRTIYVKEAEQYSTTLPGAPRRLDEPGETSSAPTSPAAPSAPVETAR